MTQDDAQANATSTETATAEATPAKPPSKVEEIKDASNGLAGRIEEVYESDATHFDEAEYQLLKFHGSYQQDNRDSRVERKRAKLDKEWSFMVRARIPGGRMTATQYLAFDAIAGECSNGTLRLTSRQSIQYHGVGKENLKRLIRWTNDVRLSTISACGDVNRNTMCCPVSDLDWRAGLGLEALCNAIADHFTPHSTAYWEIWCDGERWGEPVTPNREEPIYGKHYLPRKFKMAVTVPEDNCVDAYTQDISAEAVHKDGKLLAWDLIVGGGMGYSHSAEATKPLIGKRLVRVAPEDALAVIETIVKIQRDYGDRADRKHARMKYVMDERGPEWFRAQIAERMGREFPEAGPAPEYKVLDHLGWNDANDGTLFVGVHIPGGRIKDFEGGQWRTGLRAIVERFQPGVRLTAKQDIILTGIAPADKAAVQAMLDAHGLFTDAGVPMLQRLSMACVALPTCGLALAESERYMPTLLTQLRDRGLGDAPVEIRMTGCPNSCVRTPMAEIGIVGRGPRKYAVYLGGDQGGTRLAYLYEETVTDEALPGMIEGLVNAWRADTQQGVSFGAWSAQQGRAALQGRLAAGNAAS